MELVALVENPWCLSSLLLVIVLLVIAAALVARRRALPAQTQRLVQQAAPRTVRFHEHTATAPFEALTVIEQRLGDMQRHLPPDSDDARWLEAYRNDLRNVMDDVYWALYHATGADRSALLERLDREVALLDQAISAELVAQLSITPQRAGLHAQLEQLRQSIEQ